MSRPRKRIGEVLVAMDGMFDADHPPTIDPADVGSDLITLAECMLQYIERLEDPEWPLARIGIRDQMELVAERLGNKYCRKVEPGAASIRIELDKGDITIFHGTGCNMLHEYTQVEPGTWEGMFDSIRAWLSGRCEEES